MTKPEYSVNPEFTIAAHLVHSRVQMLPNRIRYGGPFEIAAQNRGLLEAAARSVTADHGITVEFQDIVLAAELLYRSQERKSELKVYVLIHTDYQKRTKQEVTSHDDGITVVPAGKDEWFATNEEAAVLADKIRRKRAPGYHLHVGTRWAMPKKEKAGED